MVEHHASKEPEPAEDGEQNEEPDEEREEAVRTQTCRFCTSDMHMTGSKVRPRVYELMEMPLARFRRAQVGMRVTLGAKLPEIIDKRRDDPTAPVMNRHTAE